MKGEFGYLKNKKKQTMLRTGILFLITLLIFLTGYVIFHSNRSIFSILAAVLCIPTAVSAVNMIMYKRATECTDELYSLIESHKGGLLILYDLYMTAYETTYPVLSATVLKDKILCLLQGDDTKCAACEQHIRTILSDNALPAAQITVLPSVEDYCHKLDELEKERVDEHLDPVGEEAAWQPGTPQTLAGILCSISL